MSRDDGFAVADMDSGYFDDAKLRDLWQRLHDPVQMARAVVLHQATVLASWRQGCRVTVGQACPLWASVDVDVLEALVAVKLLDRGGRLPVASWTEWFGAAQNRREIRRESGRRGGLASGKARSTSTTDGEATVQHPLTDAEPVRPSVPTDRPSVARAGARGAVARATNGRTGCIKCGGAETPGNPYLALADGRVKHRFSPCPSGSDVGAQALDAMALASVAEGAKAYSAAHPTDPQPPEKGSDWFDVAAGE